MDQRSLMSKLQAAADKIAKASSKGSADQLLVSSYIADKWQDLFINDRRKEKIEELWGISRKDTTGHT